MLSTLSRGIGITIFVTLVGFFSASVLGLLLAVASTVAISGAAPDRPVLHRDRPGRPDHRASALRGLCLCARLGRRVELDCGGIGLEPVRTRDFTLLWRAILALTIGYSAFIAEVFRAGLQSIDKGQIEAANALGLSPWLRFRLIVFPQAFRVILPPLGNDFIAMVKDSSLVSVLGVFDVTQAGKVTAAGNFRYFETYNVVALIYLMITISLSLVLRRLERRMRERPGSEH